MIKRYTIAEGKIAETQKADPEIFVAINANEDERRWFTSNYQVDEHTFNSAFDPEEPARVEYEPEHIAVIFKRAKTHTPGDNFHFRISSCGLFLFKNTLIITLTEDVKIFYGKHFKCVKSIKDIFLKVLYGNITHFNDHLKTINMVSEELEDNLMHATDNEDLVHTFAVEKSLVYYLNAISSNGAVLDKLKANQSKTGFDQYDIETIDDILIDNQQCYKQAEITSNVFASLSGTRATIVSNNLNIHMKNLNMIVIALAIPSFFAGVGGMSELTAITGIEDMKIAYSSFFIAMMLIVILTIKLLQFMEHRAGQIETNPKKTVKEKTSLKEKY